MFSKADEGIQFIPSATVPLIEKQAYGWRLRVNTDRTSVSVREEFELPVAPKTWGDAAPGSAISEDGKTYITTGSLTPDRGYLQNVWFVAPEDPAGSYVIRVFIDDALAATFKFTAK